MPDGQSKRTSSPTAVDTCVPEGAPLLALLDDWLLTCLKVVTRSVDGKCNFRRVCGLPRISQREPRGAVVRCLLGGGPRRGLRDGFLFSHPAGAGCGLWIVRCFSLV